MTILIAVLAAVLVLPWIVAVIWSAIRFG